jgi:hypothetical protein
MPLSQSSRLLVPVVTASIFALGCGGAEPDEGPGPAQSEVVIDSASYSLEPGEEKRYLCYTERLPDDKETVITEIVPTYGKGMHHLAIYYTLAAEPEGISECPELFNDTWVPLYTGGVESGTLKLPEGAGFKLAKRQQILIQLHLLNATSDPIEDKTVIRFKTAEDSPDIKPAGIYGFDNRSLNIPALTMDHEESMSCSDLGREMDVFAVLGHMHQTGKGIEVYRGSKTSGEKLYETVWNFDNQPTLPASFHLSPADTVDVRCRFDNPTDKTVTYGESSFTEMCAFVLYYTPYDHLDGCIKMP